MRGRITVSTIIFIIIALALVYGILKVFIWKEPIGIAALDKLIIGKMNEELIGNWQRIDDTTYKLRFNEDGHWYSPVGVGIFNKSESDCIKLQAKGGARSGSTFFLYITAKSTDTMTIVECTTGCDCSGVPHQYSRIKYVEKKIMKEY